jgi:hypothetical protein
MSHNNYENQIEEASIHLPCVLNNMLMMLRAYLKGAKE